MNLRKDHSHIVSFHLLTVNYSLVALLLEVPAGATFGLAGGSGASGGSCAPERSCCQLFSPSGVLLSCVVLFLPVGGNRHTVNASLQLSATDVSARTTMKGAAKCDKHCDLQNSVNQQGFERILRFRVPLKACLLQCLLRSHASDGLLCCQWWSLLCWSLVFVHQGACALDA